MNIQSHAPQVKGPTQTPQEVMQGGGAATPPTTGGHTLSSRHHAPQDSPVKQVWVLGGGATNLLHKLEYEECRRIVLAGQGGDEGGVAFPVGTAQLRE